ncbi:MAG: transcription elongation factor GreA [Candidatus Wildermuthbacteria bacterium]|nr:transcription elongation factor GreA [Candidatus Wildermuthbacteria bacterium]
MTYITKEGLEKLQKELEHLKTVKRKELTERLRKAISFGDLSENFDYHNAKEEQEMLERRIAEIEDTLASSRMVSEKNGNGVVQIGSVVTVKANGETLIFTITGSAEADPLENKISAESPLGQALLGKKKEAVVQIETPEGVQSYKVLDIS